MAESDYHTIKNTCVLFSCSKPFWCYLKCTLENKSLCSIDQVKTAFDLLNKLDQGYNKQTMLQNVKTVSRDSLGCLGSSTTAVTVTKGFLTHVQGFKYHRLSGVRYMRTHRCCTMFKLVF